MRRTQTNPHPSSRTLLELAVVGTVTLTVTLPFILKAFHVDDTLFVYASRQIRRDPLRPYDFILNWNGTDEHMWNVTKNPPLASYCLAFSHSLFGETEAASHLTSVLFALLCTGCAWWLAMQVGAPTLWSGLLVATSPAFVVTASGVSSDTIALGFYMLAAAAFISGTRSNRSSLLILGAAAAGLSSVAKYVGITSILLLAAYSVIRARRPTWHLATLLISLAIFALWAAHGWYFYGKPHFLTATTYWSEIRAGADEALIHSAARRLYFIIATTVFFGAAVNMPLALAPFTFRRPIRSSAAAALVTAALVALLGHMLPRFAVTLHSPANWALAALWLFLATLFLRAAFRPRCPLTAELVLLWLWLAGILIFQAFFNWTVAFRIVLFAVPPAALLIAKMSTDARVPRPVLPATVAVSAIIALAVTAADARWAHSYRHAAHVLRADRPTDSRGFFHAHWGLQYYLEKNGPQRWQFLTPDIALRRGDWIVVTPIALHDGAFFQLIERQVELGTLRPVKQWTQRPLLHIHTQNRDVGVGLYSSADGPLPFGVGTSPSEIFSLYEVTR